MGELTIRIETGNDALRTAQDVSKLLAKVGTRIFKDEREGKIIDDNGNTVGRFELTIDEEA